ncbi:hypothetical protein [Flagellimonas sp. S3867]|uniref:hypothetical protein n=1 Tax=Flagellimonas sp. S3867 TaxID=2768063 RepID=UPI0016868D2D|nr:hypothetical protein [Flagellimonas sp. S3867]
MFFKLKSYLKFLLKSTNQHGVHSPFVFAFVTKCLYSKRKWRHKKTIKVLLKSIDYFDFRSIKLDDPSLKEIIQHVNPKIMFASNKVDILYTKGLSKKRFDQLLSEQILHNNSMILIDGIHSNQKKEELWEDLIQIPNITVSIDMFHCGALFIRKEQVKEHFTIRI